MTSDASSAAIAMECRRSGDSASTIDRIFGSVVRHALLKNPVRHRECEHHHQRHCPLPGARTSAEPSCGRPLQVGAVRGRFGKFEGLVVTSGSAIPRLPGGQLTRGEVHVTPAFDLLLLADEALRVVFGRATRTAVAG